MNKIDQNKLLKAKWRVVRKVGRTIYAQVKDTPSNNDILIGVFDTKGLAKRAVSTHNELL